MSDQQTEVETLTIIVKTFPDKREIKVRITPADTLSDAKSQLVEAESASRPFSNYSFALEGSDEPLPSNVSIGEILQDGAVIEAIPDAYNASESTLHVIKVRDILGFEGQAMAYPIVDGGATLFDTVAREVANDNDKKYIPDEIATEGKTDEEIAKATAELRAKEPTVLDHPFAEDPNSSVTVVTPNNIPVLKKGVRSLQLSQWNPPPPGYQMRGHLLYLQTSTIEGQTYHITSSTTGFYVSNCSGERFDPSPRKISGKYYKSECLLTLLKQLSPAIEKTIENNHQKLLGEFEPLQFVRPSNAFLGAPWLVNEPKTSEITPDLARTQDKLQERLVGEGARDWNEDYQSAREMPLDTENSLNDKVTRERLLNRLSFDFTEEAVRQAIRVINGDIMPLNPNEPKKSHVYMYNNMFFSHAADGIGAFESEGGDEAARVAAGKDLSHVNFVNQMDIDGLYQLLTVVVDYRGHRVVCQGPVPGIFRETETQQIVYGAIDGRESIEFSEEFEPLMKQIGDACHVKSHKAFDKNGENGKQLSTPLEAKGLNGTDGRKYILDLYRLSPPDLSFIEKFSNDAVQYPHKMASIRLEAVDDWFRSKAREFILEKEKTKESTEEESKEKTDEELEKIRAEQEAQMAELREKYCLNPDVTLDESTLPADALEQYKKDQEEVRQVSAYLTDTIIPKFLSDIAESLITTPLDGDHLTMAMHRKGISMRYLGALYEGSKKHGIILSALRDLIVREALSRSVKHIWNGYVSNVPAGELCEFAAYFFNLLIGFNGAVSSKPKSAKDLTLESLRAQVKSQVQARFRLDLAEDWYNSVSLKALLREVSKKIGAQWRSRNYNLETAPEATSSKKNQTKSVFVEADFLNIVPIVKASTFKSSLAENAMEAARHSLRNGDQETGIVLLNEALSLFEQVYGTISPMTGQAYNVAGTMFHELKDYDAACELSRKSIIILERTEGPDSYEIIYALLNLAVYENQRGNNVGMLRITKYAMELWNNVSGGDHPDVLSTILNIASALMQLKDYKRSLELRQKALKLALKYYDDDSLTVGQVQYSLSEALTLNQDLTAAVDAAKAAHTIFLKLLGEENESTIEIKRWIELLEPAAQRESERARVSTTNGNSHAHLVAAHKNSQLRQRQLSHQGAQQLQQQTSAVSNVDGLAASRRSQNANKSIDELMNYINGTASSSKKKSKKSKK